MPTPAPGRLLHKRLFYKTAFAAAQTLPVTFFANARGGATYTKFVTNSEWPGSIPTKRAYRLQALGFHHEPVNTADDAPFLAWLFKNAVFEVRVAGVSVIDWEPVGIWPSGAGFVMPTATALFDGMLGRDSRMRKLSPEVDLAEGNTFQVNMEFGAACSGITATPTVVMVLDLLELVGNVQ
jgi:hypothetical protein